MGKVMPLLCCLVLFWAQPLHAQSALDFLDQMDQERLMQEALVEAMQRNNLLLESDYRALKESHERQTNLFGNFENLLDDSLTYQKCLERKLKFWKTAIAVTVPLSALIAVIVTAEAGK